MLSALPSSPLDRLGRGVRDLRVSVTDRCNFRCRYCMPREHFGEGFGFLPRESLLSFAEIFRTVKLVAGLGLRKVRLTGGEPLLRKDLPKLVGQLATLPGLELTLTTNGVLLEKLAAPLRSAGLQRLTVSLDSLDPEVFRKMTDSTNTPRDVLIGIAAAERAGFGALKINCVVARGKNESSIVELARHFRGTGHIVRFIEYMDVGQTNGWQMRQVLAAGEINQRLQAEFELEALPENYAGEVAKRFRHRDGSGEIGIIASITQPFCGQCTRLRLSADGQLFTCLFAAKGYDFRAQLRSGASDLELAAELNQLWLARADRYSELRVTTQRYRLPVEMSYIGG